METTNRRVSVKTTVAHAKRTINTTSSHDVPVLAVLHGLPLQPAEARFSAFFALSSSKVKIASLLVLPMWIRPEKRCWRDIGRDKKKGRRQEPLHMLSNN